jgi:uncharacterized protein (TIGR02453 family)
MTEILAFSGFPPAGLQFMAELADNNNREWFNERKQVYLDHIVAPAVAFVQTAGEQLQFISPGIQFDTRTNGQGSLMRIYRDTRFSKDKTPYKTWVGLVFWEGAGKKTENPGFYFGFDTSGGRLHTGVHGFQKELLAAYREAVADDDSGAELEAALAEVAAAGPYEIGEQHYKRVPRGYDSDHPRADLLRFNSLYASSPNIEPAVLSSASLVDVVLEHCQNTLPLHRWLVKVNEATR